MASVTLTSSRLAVLIIRTIYGRCREDSTNYEPEWEKALSGMSRSVRRMHMVLALEPPKQFFYPCAPRSIASSRKNQRHAHEFHESEVQPHGLHTLSSGLIIPNTSLSPTRGFPNVSPNKIS